MSDCHANMHNIVAAQYLAIQWIPEAADEAVFLKTVHTKNSMPPRIKKMKEKLLTSSLFLYSFVSYKFKALAKEGVAHF